MRLTPIIAVIDNDTHAAIADCAALIDYDLPDDHELRRLMARNGWTFEAMAAGRLLMDALDGALTQIDRQSPGEPQPQEAQQEHTQ